MKKRESFTKLLSKFNAHGYTLYNVFSDFLKVSALTISNCSDPYHIRTSKEIFDQREEEYKQIMNRYKLSMRLIMPQMLAEIVKELEDNDLTDVLGKIFEELNFNDEYKSQFFTPMSVSEIMSKLTFDSEHIQQKINETGSFSLYDPCCGSGSLLLGAVKTIRELGFNPQTQLLIYASDVDERCVHMCYLQLSLYGIPAIVVHQNALTQETIGEPWYTPFFVINPKFLRKVSAA